MAVTTRSGQDVARAVEGDATASAEEVVVRCTFDIHGGSAHFERVAQSTNGTEDEDDGRKEGGLHTAE